MLHINKVVCYFQEGGYFMFREVFYGVTITNRFCTFQNIELFVQFRLKKQYQNSFQNYYHLGVAILSLS